MAIIFNIQEALKLSAFNVYQEPIQMLMTNEDEAWEKESLISKVFTMRKLNSYQEEFRTRTSMDNFKPGHDVEPAEITDFEEGYGKVIKSVTWRNSFVISLQAIEDNQEMTITADAFGFVKTYGRTREMFAFGMLASALNGSFTYQNWKFDTTGMDTTDASIDGPKQKYFHKTHRSPVDAGAASDGSGDKYAPQSNKFHCAINLASPNAHRQILSLLGQVETKMMNYEDYKGNPLQVAPTTILVANHYAFRDALLTALKTQYTEVLGDNGVNLQYGRWTVLTTPYLNKYAGFTAADQAMIIIDPKVNRENLGAVFIDRVPLSVNSYYDEHNELNIWKGRARYSAAFGDFRAMAYINTGAAAVDDATELTIENVAPSPSTFTVSFSANGAKASGMPAGLSGIYYGSKINAPTTNPTAAGKVFDGWYKEAAATNAWDFGSDTVSSDVILYAKWVNTYTVTFSANGKTATGMPSPITGVLSGAKITKPTPDPAATGFTFDGWYKQADTTGAWVFGSDTVTADTTLYAKWAE